MAFFYLKAMKYKKKSLPRYGKLLPISSLDLAIENLCSSTLTLIREAGYQIDKGIRKRE